jgi:hypothetical protein
MKKQILTEWAGLAVVLVTMSFLFLRQITNATLIHTDADRYLMDGIFFVDFFREMPLDRIYDFTARYYVQYPALSISYKMPFFPMVEAIFNAVFGLHVWSSRLAVLAFALCGVTAWYKLIQRIFSNEIAFWSSLVLVTTPFLVQWAWYPMSEIPFLSMTLLTAFFFYRYTEDLKPGYLYLTAVFLGLSVLTKQTAVFMILWFVPYLLVRPGWSRCLKRKEIWISFLLGLLCLAPFIFITLRYGTHNILQSIGVNRLANPGWRFDWNNLKIYWLTLAKVHLTLPVFLLSLAGLGGALLKRDFKVIYFVFSIFATYIFFTYLVAKDARYPISWIPAFSLFAVLPLFYLQRKKIIRRVVAGVLFLIIGYQVGRAYAVTPQYAVGYREAAEYVIHHRNSPMVLFDGHFDGHFIYFIRVLDPAKSIFVLRADKLLNSPAVKKSNGIKFRQGKKLSQADIQNILDEYGVEYLVVETKTYVPMDNRGYPLPPRHPELYELLANREQFQLVKEIPIRSNWGSLRGQTVKIYWYVNAKPRSAEFIEYNVPVIGTTIKVPLEAA